MEEYKIKIGIDVDDKPIKSLKLELRETIEALQMAESGTEEFEKLNYKAAELRDKMADINEQVSVFASGSKYEQAGNSIGQIGDALRNLDFEKAQERAGSLAKVAKSITFKDVSASLKQLGGTFVSIGKTILTNPLFIMAVVIAAIVGAVILLLKELGVLDDIVKAVGDAIGFAIQKLKDFMDWLGLTSYAAEDAASKQAKAQEKIAESYSKKRDRVVDSYDQEIKIAGIAGENTVKLERQKQYAIIETSIQQKKALEAEIIAMRAAGTLTKEKADEIRKAINELKTGIREAVQEIQVINATEVAENKKKNQEITTSNVASAKERQATRKQNEADRISASRSIIDAEISLMKEGNDKEIFANNEKYKRLIEDTKRNEKLLASEKNSLIALLETQGFEARKAIENKYLEETNLSVKTANESRKVEGIGLTEFQLNQFAETDAAKKKSEEYNEQLEEESLNRKKKIASATADVAKSGLQGIADLVSAFAGKSLSAQKRAFEINKKLSIGMATIDMIKGSVSAYSGMVSSIPGPAGIVLGAFAAAGVIASGVAQIKKIKSTTFDGGGASGGGGGEAMGGGASFGSALQTPQTPQMNLNQNTGLQSAGGESKKERVIVVDYNDISEKGNELQNMKQRVTLA